MSGCGTGTRSSDPPRPPPARSRAGSLESRPTVTTTTEPNRGPVRKRLILHRAASRALQGVLHAPARRRTAPTSDGAVRFLVMDLHARGGYLRSNLLLASGLAERHDVEVLSAFTLAAEPFYPVPATVAARVLDDRHRPGASLLQRSLSRIPSPLAHPDEYLFEDYSSWTDVQLVRALRRLRGGWLVTTRPSLHLLAARFAHPSVVVVAREHDVYTKRRPSFLDELRATSGGVDAVSTLTVGDEHDYAALLAGTGTSVFQAPNALEPLPGGPVPQRSRTVVAAGRLTPQKGFDLLLRAWAPVAAEQPGWRLAIFGDGPHRDRLEALVVDLDLTGSVDLRPSTPHLGQELAAAGAFVCSSRFEGFGRVVLEAMSKGAPVISYDCPRGPGEIITDGVDGLLVPAEDVGALSEALLRVMGDAGLRERLAAAGPTTAARYDLPTITDRWEAELARAAGRRPVAR